MRVSVRTTFAAILLAAGLASGLVLGIGLVAPRVTIACSCVAPTSLAEYAGEETAIFSGTVVAHDGEGIRVTVDQCGLGVLAVVAAVARRRSAAPP